MDLRRRRDEMARRRPRRLAGAVVVVVALTVGAVGCGEVGEGAPAAPDGFADDAGSPSPTTAPLEPDTFGEQRPPDLVLRGDAGPVRAATGSFCWGPLCSDSVRPEPDSLPDLGPVADLEAAFPLTARWYVSTTSLERGRCAHYPVLVEATGPTSLRFAPSGPAGARVGAFGADTTKGGTSGAWRWTVPPRDGEPLAWVSLTTNTALSGGAEDLTVVLDDAAVDGEVSATMTIRDADGVVTEVPTPEVDQGCDGDGYASISTSFRLRQGLLDDLGPLPYTYEVDVVVDGVTHRGTGVFAGEHTDAGGDTRLTFDPPLPALDR